MARIAAATLALMSWPENLLGVQTLTPEPSGVALRITSATDLGFREEKFAPDGTPSDYTTLSFIPDSVAFVPEPSTYALLLLSGAASLYALKRRNS